MTLLLNGRLQIDDILATLASENELIYKSRTLDELTDFVAAIKTSLNWKLIPSSDGEISIVENKKRTKDYSSNGEYFALHTDGLYYDKPPQFVLLCCDNAGNIPVPTFFLDTSHLLDRLYQHDDQAVRILQRLEQVFIDRAGREFHRPVIEKNTLDGDEVMNITFGRAYLRPMRHLAGTGDEPHQVEIANAFQAVLRNAGEMKLTYHSWSKGDFLIWDNHRFIHGRGPTDLSVGRRLMRAWLSPRELHTRSS